MFKDRNEAGFLLADKLEKYKKEDAIVLAIPRGGVPVAFIVAQALNLPLEVVLSKKIGHPYQKEYAIGAVTLKSSMLSDAATGISTEYIEKETQRTRELLKKRYREYYGNKKPLELKGKVLIVVDDGIATGNTIMATIEMLYEEKPKKIVVAIPVAPPDTIDRLKRLYFIDEVICLLKPIDFRAVGQFYQIFDQVDDRQVKQLLQESNKTPEKN